MSQNPGLVNQFSSTPRGRLNCQKSFGNPNPYWSRRKYGSTPPICTAVRPPFVLLDLPGGGGLSLKKGKPNSTPPICTAVRLPFVRQYASHLYGNDAFEKILGVWEGKEGSICHFRVSLVFQCFLGFQDAQMLGKTAQEKCHCHTPLFVCAPSASKN